VLAALGAVRLAERVRLPRLSPHNAR
jgi:hypothetical protein